MLHTVSESSGRSNLRSDLPAAVHTLGCRRAPTPLGVDVPRHVSLNRICVQLVAAASVDAGARGGCGDVLADTRRAGQEAGTQPIAHSSFCCHHFSRYYANQNVYGSTIARGAEPEARCAVLN